MSGRPGGRAGLAICSRKGCRRGPIPRRFAPPDGAAGGEEPVTDTDPLWYKDAVLYQIHVRAYQDSSGDGIGDFRGLRQRLDHIQDLRVTAVWVQPFCPSPLKDDGYDIADYTTVNPQYGTLKDFRDFLDAAHRRGIRVITE